MPKIRWIAPSALVALLAAATAALAADEEKVKFDDLPKAVKKAVKAKYPGAKILGASKEKDDGETVYEVEMTVDGKSIDIVLDDEGEIEATEEEIEVEDLPRAVIKAAKAKFPGGKIEKVEQITDEDDMVVYELAISSKEKKSVEVVMNPAGKILEPDEKDEDEAKKKEQDDDKKGEKKEKDDDDDKKEKKPKA